MLLVTETNHGLAYERDVKVSFETFNDVIFCCHGNQNPPKTYPSKVSFLNISLKLTW